MQWTPLVGRVDVAHQTLVDSEGGSIVGRVVEPPVMNRSVSRRRSSRFVCSMCFFFMGSPLVMADKQPHRGNSNRCAVCGDQAIT